MEKVHTKFEMEKFDESGDFSMWKFMMLMQLELQGLGHILSLETSTSKKETDSESSVTDQEVKKDPLAKEKVTRARNLICSSLTNIVLRKVMKETIALGGVESFRRGLSNQDSS